MAEQDKIQIDPENYLTHLGMIFRESARTRLVRTEDILDAMNRELTLSVVHDSTAWINEHIPLAVQKEIVEAYRTFQRRIEEIAKEHGVESALHAIVST